MVAKDFQQNVTSVRQSLSATRYGTIRAISFHHVMRASKRRSPACRGVDNPPIRPIRMQGSLVVELPTPSEKYDIVKMDQNGVYLPNFRGWKSKNIWVATIQRIMNHYNCLNLGPKMWSWKLRKKHHAELRLLVAERSRVLFRWLLASHTWNFKRSLSKRPYFCLKRLLWTKRAGPTHQEKSWTTKQLQDVFWMIFWVKNTLPGTNSFWK